jgi:hypothetical protein
MDRHSVSMGLKNRREENGATEDPLGRHVLKRSRRSVGTNRQKPGEIGLARLLIKLSNCVWFHEPAAGFIGLIRLIYLFIYLFILL